jgi:hypothetical protein
VVVVVVAVGLVDVALDVALVAGLPGRARAKAPLSRVRSTENLIVA